MDTITVTNHADIEFIVVGQIQIAWNSLNDNASEALSIAPRQWLKLQFEIKWP